MAVDVRDLMHREPKGFEVAKQLTLAWLEKQAGPVEPTAITDCLRHMLSEIAEEKAGQ